MQYQLTIKMLIDTPFDKERVARHFEQWGVDQSPKLLTNLEDALEQANADDSNLLRSLIEG